MSPVETEVIARTVSLASGSHRSRVPDVVSAPRYERVTPRINVNPPPTAWRAAFPGPAMAWRAAPRGDRRAQPTDHGASIVGTSPYDPSPSPPRPVSSRLRAPREPRMRRTARNRDRRPEQRAGPGSAGRRLGDQPPATAGRMDTVSPSDTGVSSDPRYRTSSSFRYTLMNRCRPPSSAITFFVMPGYRDSRSFRTSTSVEPSALTFASLPVCFRKIVGSFTVTAIGSATPHSSLAGTP